MSQNVTPPSGSNGIPWGWIIIAVLVIWAMGNGQSWLNSLNTTSLAISNADQSNTLAAQATTIDSLTGNVSSMVSGISTLLAGQQQAAQQLGTMSGQMNGLSQMMQSTLAGVTDLQKSVGQMQGTQNAMSDLLGRFDIRLTSVEQRVNTFTPALQPQLQSEVAPLGVPLTHEVTLPDGRVLKPGEHVDASGQIVDANGFVVQR